VKQLRITLLAILIILLASSPPLAQPAAILLGRVTRVSDGDTVWLQVADRFQWLHIRFYGVDTPESEWPSVWPAQPFSAEAKKFVIEQVSGKQVAVQLKDEKTYDRVVGELFVDGQSLSRKLLEFGLAWWNRKYAPDNPDFKHLEEEARAKKIGLWSQNEPVPPWVFRHKYQTK
jgi:endonuclease YncB( thermonuclease family)